MPFINVDYKTRDKMVKDYLVRKKLVRDKLLAEKVGDIELQQKITKFFKPLTKSQKEIQEEATKTIGRYQLEAARRITEGLTPIREGIQQLPGRITEGLAPIREGVQQLPGAITEGLEPIREKIVKLPIQLSKEITSLLPTGKPPSYEEVKILKNKEEIHHFLKVFNEKFMREYKRDFDDIYRIVFDKNSGKFHFGNKEIFLDPKNKGIFYFEEEEIPASDGLWELILSKNPKNFTVEDFNNYQLMLRLSDIMFVDNNRKSGILKTYNNNEKWKKIITPVIKDIIKEQQATGKGLRKKKTTIVVPSDPNALLERFDLLMSSKDAGHTGVKNELVSICDELKRQKVLNAKRYKTLMSLL